MKVTVNWKKDYVFEASDEKGFKCTFDHPEQESPEGMNPLVALLMGLGGCMGLKAMIILKKMKQDVEDLSFEISAEQEEEEPKAFSKIELTCTIKGNNLAPNKVDYAFNLAKEKYCPAIAILKNGTPIECKCKIE